MNLKSAVNEFLITQKIKGNSLKTIEYYSEVLQYFLDFIGDIELETLKLSDLNRYYIEQSNRNISSVTVQSYMRGLRAFLNWCYGEEYMTVKLTEKFKLPKSQICCFRCSTCGAFWDFAIIAYARSCSTADCAKMKLLNRQSVDTKPRTVT